MKNKKVGLVLSGGGARGFAHLGVLRILEKNKIKIDMISGTSMGAVIGAAYALNPNIKEVSKKVKEFVMKYNIDPKIPLYGLIGGNKIERFLENLYKNKNIEDTKIPLYINTVDIIQKKEVIFSRGKISKIARASVSIPGVFSPVNIKNFTLVDGGVLNNIQEEILIKNGADIIITVNLFPNETRKKIINPRTKRKTKTPLITQTIANAIHILMANSATIERAKKNSDFFIEPKLADINMSDFGKRKHIIRLGEKATKKQIKEIKNLLK